MFKKLRNHFLLMNLCIITVLMLISFTVIYLITANFIYASVDRELYKTSEFNKRNPQDAPNMNSFPQLPKISNFENPPTGEVHDTSTTGESIDDAKNSDSAKSDDGVKYGAEDEDEDEGENENENENEAAYEKEKNQEIFGERIAAFLIITDSEYNLRSWITFFKTDTTFLNQALELAVKQDKEKGKFKLAESDWTYLKKETNSGYTFSFVDMTTQQDVLDRLILTFITVSIVMMAIIFFISRFLTEKAIHPIKEAFEKQKQFISDASHELKTPLAVIGTNVDVLLTTEENHDNKWLKYIQTEVVRMGQLTNDLLYLTQIENAEDHQMMKSELDLSRCAEQILLGLEVVAYEKGIQLSYELLPDAMVYGNPEQLAQVMMILLDNAIKYTPEKGHIALTITRSQHHYALAVSNTGAGISPDDLTKIFDRFYRVDQVRSRESGSYGLGLSIAKSIVEQHGGKMTCHSKPDELTTFSFRLKALN